jgi:hypothetical protein
MKTGRFCPHCGRPLLKSQIKGYTFQCFACDEDFCKFEVLRKKDLVRVRKIQKLTVMREQSKGIYCHSVKKPYPRYYITR